MAEYYQSLKYCEKIIDNLNYEKNISYIEIYQLIALNYIQMFDLEKAKVFLKICESIDINNNKNKEILLLIQEEEKKNEENIKKYKSYPSYLNFMKTLYKMGIYMNKVEINFVSDNYRFCRAKKDIYRNEMLFTIPLKSLITLDTAKESQIGKYFTDKIKNKLYSSRHSLLTVFLLNEMDKGNQSKWKFYIDFLPSNYSSFPTFFSTKELEYLKGTQFLEILEKKKNNIKNDYDILIKEIPGLSKYNFSFFKKMREVVGSRVFGVNIRNHSNTIIVPFADLLNHKRPTKTYWNYNNIKEIFYIKSIHSIAMGDEVFDSYGIKSNSIFLLNYGFTVENNTENTIYIKIPLNETYPYLKQKMSFLNYTKKNKFFQLKLNLKEVNAEQFFSFLRLLLYNESDFINIKTKKPTSIENEKEVLKKIKEIMAYYINKYPTNLEDDINYLKKYKNMMDFNEYNCYVIRKSEKEILYFYFNMAKDILQLFNIDNKSYMSQLYKKMNTSRYDYAYDNDSFYKKLFKYKEYLLPLFPSLIEKKEIYHK